MRDALHYARCLALRASRGRKQEKQIEKRKEKTTKKGKMK